MFFSIFLLNSSFGTLLIPQSCSEPSLFTWITREREISKRFLASRPQRPAFEWGVFGQLAIFPGRREISLQLLGRTAKSIINHVRATINDLPRLLGSTIDQLALIENPHNREHGAGIFAFQTTNSIKELYNSSHYG